MFSTDLSYVRTRLSGLAPAERAALAKKIRVSDKTLQRIAAKKTGGTRADTIGKLVIHFRTQEQRAK